MENLIIIITIVVVVWSDSEQKYMSKEDGVSVMVSALQSQEFG